MEICEAVVRLLGESQTFMGVLVAIVVLMFYRHNGNPFYLVLNTTKNEWKMELFDEVNEIRSHTIATSDNYQRLVKYSEDQDTPNAYIYDSFLTQINIESNQGIVDFQPKALVGHITNILDWREIYQAPLFTFCFCILVFICDELLRLPQSDKVMTFNVLFWFVVVSVVYWIFVWGRYFYDAWFLREYEMSDRVNRSYKKELIGYIMFIVLVLILLSEIGLVHNFLNYIDVTILLTVIAILLLKGILATKGLLGHTANFGTMNYIFTIKHFVYILVFSLVLAKISSTLTGAPLPYQSPFYNEIGGIWQFGLLKLTIFGVIIANGIILPILLPYIIYQRYRYLAGRKCEELLNDYDRLYKQLDAEIADFLKDNPKGK